MNAFARGDKTGRFVGSLLIGVVIAALVGVGVRVIAPAPDQSIALMQRLSSQQKALDESMRLASGQRGAGGMAGSAGGLSGSHQALYAKITAQITARKKRLETDLDSKARGTGLGLVALAALLIGVSFVVPDRRLAVPDGLLFGGAFTAVYGLVQALAITGPGIRYSIVAAVGAMVLAAFYWRFRRSRAVGGAAQRDPVPSEG